MDNQTSPLEAETQVIKSAYAALNRNDIDGFVKDFGPQIERIEFEGSPNAGAYHGIDDVKAHVAKSRSTWAEGSCEPTGFFAAGDKLVVFCHVRVRLKNQPDWLEGRTADVYTFRDGKVIEFRTFADESEARAYAGVE